MENEKGKVNGIFNIRVYAMLINDEEEVLIAEEFHYNTFMRKFPGGGLEFGEGILDCVKRELKEELNFELKIAKHIYTTDFFIQSAFNSSQQVIAVYYTIAANEIISNNYRSEYEIPSSNGTECFRWIKIENILEDDFTLVADKAAAIVLKDKWKSGKLKFQ